MDKVRMNGNPLTGEINYPVREQLDALGLSRSDVRSYRGKMVLDVGCGSMGGLVYSLRQSGVKAEGIDPLVRNSKDFLIRQEITPENPIPRKDGTYDLVLAHSVMPLDYRFTSYMDVASCFQRALGMGCPSKDVLEKGLRDGESILRESLRVLKNTGKMIIFHRANRLGEFEKEIQDMGYKISHNTTGDINGLKGVASRIGIDVRELAFMRQRTVIEG